GVAGDCGAAGVDAQPGGTGWVVAGAHPRGAGDVAAGAGDGQIGFRSAHGHVLRAGLSDEVVRISAGAAGDSGAGVVSVAGAAACLAAVGYEWGAGAGGFRGSCRTVRRGALASEAPVR